MHDKPPSHRRTTAAAAAYRCECERFREFRENDERTNEERERKKDLLGGKSHKPICYLLM